MASLNLRNSLLILLSLTYVTISAGQEKIQPLEARTLVALVAGGALSENVVHEIETRGLAFRRSDEFLLQLTIAGADGRILQALGKAKISGSGAEAVDKGAAERLSHLAKAGKLIRDKQFQEAAAELNDALQPGGDPAAGYVMGELLRRQEQWSMSASVYQQVLKADPDFPEVHTEMSYLYYQLGDQEEALRQARAALARTPENARAHKNAGLALTSLRKFDAALIEFKEALRIKPDYEAAHNNMGVLFETKGDLGSAAAEYKKALTLNPNDVPTRLNLASVYKHVGNVGLAIQEFREAKRLDPTNLEARQGLGSALVAGNFNAEAVIEMRALVEMAPNLASATSAMASHSIEPGTWKARRQSFAKPRNSILLIQFLIFTSATFTKTRKTMMRPWRNSTSRSNWTRIPGRPTAMPAESSSLRKILPAPCAS